LDSVSIPTKLNAKSLLVAMFIGLSATCVETDCNHSLEFRRTGQQYHRPRTFGKIHPRAILEFNHWSAWWSCYMRRLLLALSLSAISLPAAAQPAMSKPWFFAVLADPQLGMYAKDKNFAQETANFEFAVANLNRLHPRFVVVAGDFVNRTGDPAEIAEYKRILGKLDPSIPVYNVVGNHDIGNIPKPGALDRYHAAFGRDYYTFVQGDILGIALDSSLIQAPQKDAEAARQQEEWLRKTLASVKSNPHRQIVVFQHIPYFIHSPDEPDSYFNIPQPAREKYLHLLKEAGVRYVFTGHYHRNAGGIDGPLTEVVTGAVGMPLGGSQSGFRIVTVDGSKLNSKWLCFGGIPNQIDPQKPINTPCPQ
jgi:UDP-2,3-diacylglucosamine pyrophosphatase LpxH